MKMLTLLGALIFAGCNRDAAPAEKAAVPSHADAAESAKLVEAATTRNVVLIAARHGLDRELVKRVLVEFKQTEVTALDAVLGSKPVKKLVMPGEELKLLSEQEHLTEQIIAEIVFDDQLLKNADPSGDEMMNMLNQSSSPVFVITPSPSP